jgi:hypothetical protein
VEQAPFSATFCLDFEQDDLSVVGLHGEFAYMADGAIVRLVDEGDDFSALLGEQDLDLPGERSLLLRSSHLGIVGTTARVFLQVLQPARRLSWLQLSETDGLELILSSPLGWTEAPVETGGFTPSLKPEHHPIPNHPEVQHGPSIPGTFTRQAFDLTGLEPPYTLEITQTTTTDSNGFFTLLDEVCLHGV